MKFSNLKLSTPYLNLLSIFYEKVEPTPLDKPFLISISKSASQLLGVDEDLALDSKLLEIVNGEQKLEGSEPFAMCYAGHQFGDFTERLGDGRVINLGKVNGQNLQLKGAGLTLYSRLGDGRAVLHSSIREYLMSEAMHGLGIQTSRALALIGSDTDVVRDTREKGAIVLRLSPTWVRFGTFEYFYSIREYDKLRELADYVIDESFSYLKANEEAEELYLKMYAEIVKNTARTIAKWQSVGFNHGVMNTDNMSIDGRTIDYGPFAFLDDYDPNFVCNTTDTQGLYSFRNQPSAARWNLNILARVLSPLMDYELSEEILTNTFWSTYTQIYMEIMYAKIGLEIEHTEDKELVEGMIRTLGSSSIDYTLFFRKLSRFNGDKSDILDACVNREPFDKWLDKYTIRLEKETLSIAQRQRKMLALNPKYVLKNHILQEAIEKAKKHDFSMVNELLKVALTPFDEHLTLEYLCKLAPMNSKNMQLCCSS
ncbi:MAG: Selenoprotein O and cysteine-containing homologs [uncultured Sulfurovum sp.]|uniref:Protein nucleotidyltransferase YdiU n=1 Tax=uncultured Sulfurovum sp. TaxID=269237 RepID=A0A6S6S9E8_9BACT|nr:MAG: Selenoprotein O and cysteine-containing homologs [uncultured Sulfurovum sp.]